MLGSEKDFIKYVANPKNFVLSNSEGNTQTHKSILMAYLLVKSGMKVLYRITDASLTNDTIKEFSDRSLYDLRFITNGGFANSTSTPAALINCAATRGDAVALISLENNVMGNDESYLTILNGITLTDIEVGDIKEDPRKYAAAFAGTFNFEQGDYKDVAFPAYFYYLLCFAEHIKNYPSWYATAGSVRGKCNLGTIVCNPKFGDQAINDLQPRVVGNADNATSTCNAITNVRPYGNVIWGNRTLFKVSTDGLKASHFLNIRQLCCDLKKQIYRACRKFTFEPNTDILWARFKNEITPLLETMKADQGIRGYKLIAKDAGEKATLKAIIRIIPVEAVEDFDITVELADSIEIAE